jgi:hypothetical protein
VVDTRFFGIWWSKLKVAVHELEGLESVLSTWGKRRNVIYVLDWGAT